MRSIYKDVTTPVLEYAEPEDCVCSSDGRDGVLDLVLKFDKQAILNVIGHVNDGDQIILTLTGVLYDETHIEGTDCIWVRKKGKTNNS